ncbi:MAG: hypothetical protein U5P41_07450 [Gammaproteobacteria bacterium]|nr:hypothetical protein [Gammaproteobacteria bacterium]
MDFAEDFYNPALSVAEEYKRGVGYFTSSWFRFAARGLKGLAENGGTAKWIISPILEEGDWEALQKGEEAKRDQELYDRLNHMVSDIEEGLEQETQNTIAWMIADGLLDIRIAITGENLSGDFHDKWGSSETPKTTKSPSTAHRTTVDKDSPTTNPTPSSPPGCPTEKNKESTNTKNGSTKSGITPNKAYTASLSLTASPSTSRSYGTTTAHTRTHRNPRK